MKTQGWLAGLVLLAGVVACGGAAPTQSEFAACNSWFESVFGAAGTNGERPYLKRLFQDAADGVTRSRSWRGTPFQLGDKTYAHGLAFNSTKQLLVHLGSPAQRFTAEIGLENNDDTRRGEQLGQGSVTFHVSVGGKEVFTSSVRRRKDGPLPLDVSLNGASEFEIRVND